MERQLTRANFNCNLDNNVNFSPDGNWLVFDCRDDRGINGNSRLGKVNVKTGESILFYEQGPTVLGVGAASFLGSREVIAIHAIPGLLYDFTVRGGMIIPVTPPGSGVGGPTVRWLDSRDVTPPFTPGALRGGTHKHEPDATGQWIGFTYNDHIMRSKGSDLRNVGVSRRGIKVAVDRDPKGENFTGESFTILLTACVDDPRPGSDEYQRAEGDCWVGRNGYRDELGKRRRARAFRGAVAVTEEGRRKIYGELFIVDVPDDITKPGPLGPLEGTMMDYPKPPAGATVRRLTRTAENPVPALRGIGGHLRATGDGRWIACVGKAKRGDIVEDQVFVVSPLTGELRQLSAIPGGITGSPRFSPNSAYAACAAPDGSVHTISARTRDWGSSRQAAPANPAEATNLVISPDSKTIAYNRRLNGILQVFTTQAQP